ncbi:MAG: glycosyltransferase, partial [Gemmatimonadales bacterium]
MSPEATPPATRHHRVSVVIPALNEARNLPHVLPRIPGWVAEVILVDGHSTDDTVAVARQ